MTILPKNSSGCPYLFLAPMEGVGDRDFRQAIATIGGFDEAVTDFMRVPSNAHVPSLAKKYEAEETAPIPLAAQIMGADPTLMAEMAQELEKRGAPRIDVNCGCPSNTVTGRGAGSSLLKNPNYLYEIVKACVDAVSIPVTVKMRSGFEDTSLFKENLIAAEETGIQFITLHPRTKVDGYGPPARWDLIAEAKALLTIPVVGNGDILTAIDAERMISLTHCDALMIGRGSVIDPFIFHKIKAHFKGEIFQPAFEELKNYIVKYYTLFSSEMSEKGRISKLKQLSSFLFRRNPGLNSVRGKVLSSSPSTAEEFLHFILPLLKEHQEI